MTSTTNKNKKDVAEKVDMSQPIVAKTISKKVKGPDGENYTRIVRADQKQIDDWKMFYGDIHVLRMEDDKIIYVREPNRGEIGISQTVSQGNVGLAGESLLIACQLGGDLECLEDGYSKEKDYMAWASLHMSNLSRPVVVALEKL